jgi:hypothetical protein
MGDDHLLSANENICDGVYVLMKCLSNLDAAPTTLWLVLLQNRINSHEFSIRVLV